MENNQLKKLSGLKKVEMVKKESLLIVTGGTDSGQQGGTVKCSYFLDSDH